MKINPYLNFDGNCAEAFRFYEQALGGKLEAIMTFGESPMADQTPPEMKDKVMHASLSVGSDSLMGSDSMREYQPPTSYVSLQPDTAEDADRIFAALADGGTVEMPIAPTFWSVRFGMVVDRYGTPWMVNCEQAPQG